MSIKTIDEVLNIIGPFNKYQWILMFMLAYCMVNVGLQALTMTFIGNDPGWKCSDNTTFCNFTGVVTTTMTNYNYRCRMDRKDWIFPEGSSSIVTEFELVCDRSILKDIATSMVFLGWFVGSIVNGCASDKWGRRKALLSSMLLMSFPGIASSFFKHFWLFCLLKFVVGLGLGGAVTCIFILTIEFVGPKKRGFAGTFIWNFFPIGVCLIVLFGYLLSDWKMLNIVTSAPGCLIVVLNFFLPESVPWLVVNDEMDEVEKILKKIAKINHQKYPEGVKFHVKNAKNEGGNIAALYRSKPLAIHTMVLMFIWFTCSAVFYGTFLSAGKLGGNFYLVFCLTAIVSIPANVASTYLINCFGRKRTLILSLFVTALAMISAAVIPATTTGYVVSKVTLAMLAKFLITIAYNAVYIMTFELLPTTLRNLGMGLTSSAARVGSFSVTYVTYLGQIKPILPFILIGFIAVLGSLLSLILPETKGNPTRETIKEQNEILLDELNTIENSDTADDNNGRKYQTSSA